MKFLIQKTSVLLTILVVFFVVFIIGNKLGEYFFPLNETSYIQIIEGKIKHSLYTTLTKDFSVKETVLLTNSLSKLYNPRQVKAGDNYKIYASTSGKILKFIYVPSPLVNYVVDRSSQGFIVSKLVPETETKLVAVKGRINSSLWEGMEKSGLKGQNIMNFADIFQWQIDFFTDVQPGDRFMLVYPATFLDGEPVAIGSIELASYKGRAGNFTAIKFKSDKYDDYYDSKGNSFRKQFLKAPLNFKRISSHFTYRRKHPILKYVRPHLGIDYAAPMGTPVSTIGAGKIIYAGWKGGYGKTVTVRHNSTYTSQYAHLKSYAKGIKKGAFVKQGQVVGYVGSSGMSTGPHLDFRIKKNGKFVNFLKLKFPSAKSVQKKKLKEFNKQLEVSRKHLQYLESDFFSGSPALIEDYLKSQEDEIVSKSQLQK